MIAYSLKSYDLAYNLALIQNETGNNGISIIIYINSTCMVLAR
jgi:hypothetical protein